MGVCEGEEGGVGAKFIVLLTLLFAACRFLQHHDDGPEAILLQHMPIAIRLHVRGAQVSQVPQSPGRLLPRRLPPQGDVHVHVVQ